MIGAWPPTIKTRDIFEEYEELLLHCTSLESRIRELEAQLETLSPGVTRG